MEGELNRDYPKKRFALSPQETRARVAAGLGRRNRQEWRFRLYGMVSVIGAVGFLAFLFSTIIGNGIGAFWQTYIELDIRFEESVIDPNGSRDVDALRSADYGSLVRDELRSLFPEVTERRDRRALKGLVSSGAAYSLRDLVVSDPSLVGTEQAFWLLADDEVDMFVKGHIDREVEQASRRLNDKQIGWIDTLESAGRVEKRFNVNFFTSR